MNKKFELKHKIDMVIVLVSVFVLIGIVGYTQPLLIAPLDGEEVYSTEVLFSIEKGEKLLIDDNMEFTTPEIYDVRDGLKLNLVPGKYYWRVFGVSNSEIRTLTVKSVVALELVEGEDSFEVVNAGNLEMNVEIYNGTEKIDEKKLLPGEKSDDGNKFIGEEEW